MELLILLFICYSAVAGVLEAVLYGRQAAETWKWNEHIMIATKVVFVLVGYFAMPHIVHPTILESLIGFICSVLVYSFFHDGFYYEAARQINRPDYRFSSNSKTSTAVIEWPWFIRGNAFLLACLIVILKNIYL